MAEHSFDTPTKKRPAKGPADQHAFPNIQSGRYKFVSVIGSGGAGTVYRAHDTLLDKEVAIKKLHSASNDQIVRFQREAKLAGALKHENVMSALDFGVTDQNEPYLILDYENGESLTGYIKRVGRLPIVEALNIVIQIALGLHHAHKNGVIHRDIKPSNVILVAPQTPGKAGATTGGEANREGENRIAKIVDFGLAKSVHEVQNLTQVGTGLGTPRYMSPEHIRGIEVDERSDIYSLGCLIFETLTGSVPFQGATVIETLDMHLQEPPPTIASKGIECSERLEQIVARCLSKTAEDRFHSPGTLAEALRLELEDIRKARVLKEAEARKGVSLQKETRPSGSIVKITKYLVIGASAIVILVAVLAWYVIDQSKHQTTPKIQQPITSDLGDGEKIFEDDTRSGSGWWNTNHATDKDLIEFFKRGIDGKKIRGIDLSGSSLGQDGFRLLADKTKLTDLDYTEQQMTRENLRNVARIKTLDDLRLGGDKENFDPESLLELEKVQGLRVLNIGGIELNERTFEAMSHLKNLRVVQLSLCTGVTPEGLKHLLKLQDLEQLKLDSTDTDDNSVVALFNHPRISRLVLRNTKVTNGLLGEFAKNRMPTLDELDLSNSKGITAAEVDKMKKIRQRLSGKKLSVEFRPDENSGALSQFKSDFEDVKGFDPDVTGDGH